MRLVFVVGSPRSGTTLTGAVLGSHREVWDVGEYFGFYFAYRMAPRFLSRIPSGVRDEYLASLRGHACDFLRRESTARSAAVVCDTTPWNVLIADELVRDFPDALFVLCLRHYSGTIQSLARSFAKGFSWAGRDVTARATLWSTMYAAAMENLPPDRTIVVGYDALCHDPETHYERFVSAAATRLSLSERGFDRATLAGSHATGPGDGRMTLGHLTPAGVALRPIPSVNKADWPPVVGATVLPIIRNVDGALAYRYGDLYTNPLTDGRS